MECQKVRLNTRQTCLRQECPDRKADSNYSDCKDGLYIHQMTGGVINIYHRNNSVHSDIDDALYDNKSCCCCKHVTRKNVLTKQKRKKKSFGKQIHRRIRDGYSDEVDGSQVAVATSLSNEHSEKNSFSKQCTLSGSELNDSPVLTSLTGASKTIEIYGHRYSKGVCGETKHSEEGIEGSKYQMVAQKQNGRNCNVFRIGCNKQSIPSDQSENNVNSGDHETLMKIKPVRNDVSAKLDVTISNPCNNSFKQGNSISRNRKEKHCNTFITGPALNDEIDMDDLFKGQEEDTMRKQISSYSNLYGESGTQTLTYLKLAHPNYKHDETEANDNTHSTATYTHSQTSEPEPSSGYPGCTNSTNSVGPSTFFLLPDDSSEDSDTSYDISQCSKEDNVSSVSHLRKHEKAFGHMVIPMTCENDTEIERKFEDRSRFASGIGNFERLASVPTDHLVTQEDIHKAVVYGQKRDTSECNDIEVSTKNGLGASDNKSGCSKLVDDNAMGLADGGKWSIKENHENRTNVSVLSKTTDSASNHEFKSVPASLSIENSKARKLKTLKSSDSGYDTCDKTIVYERKQDRSTGQEFDCQTESSSFKTVRNNEVPKDNRTDDDTNSVPLSSNMENVKDGKCKLKKPKTAQSKEKKTLSRYECREFDRPNCDKHYLSKFVFIPNNTNTCTNVLAVLFQRSDENDLSFIKVSDEGVLLEVNISHEFESAKAEICTGDKWRDRLEDERKTHEDDVTGDSGNIKHNCINDFTLIREINKSRTDMFGVAKEVNSVPCLTNTLMFTTDITSFTGKTRALSESDLLNGNRCTDYGFAPTRQLQTTHSSDQPERQKYAKTRTELASKSVKMPVSRTMPFCGNFNDIDCAEQNHNSLNKSETPTEVKTKGKKLVRHKKRKLLKSENKSSYVHPSTYWVSSDFSLRSINGKPHQRKMNSKASLTQGHDKHEWPRREFSWHCVDSGIGSSANSDKKSTQYVMGKESAPYRIQVKTGQMAKKEL